jgi:carbon monoxide dehydrogenase subunit G
VGQISSHVEWMQDAVAIRFDSDQQEGIGTAFQTDTKVGPLRLQDKMVITEWEPGRVMGIRHTGMVTGTGRFTLEEVAGGHTRFTWEEDLHFPAWMGGGLGGRAGAPILKRIWQHNLDNLRRHFA